MPRVRNEKLEKITLYLNKDDINTLKEIALKNDTTLSNLIRNLIKEYIKNQKRKE